MADRDDLSDLLGRIPQIGADDTDALAAILGLPGVPGPPGAPALESGPQGPEGVPGPDGVPAAPPAPFDEVDYTGNLEQDQAAELTAAQAAFRDRAKQYKRQRLVVEDSEFWVALCFDTREAKEEFLRDHGLAHLGDKYLNGHAVDAALRE